MVADVTVAAADGAILTGGWVGASFKVDHYPGVGIGHDSSLTITGVVETMQKSEGGS